MPLIHTSGAPDEYAIIWDRDGKERGSRTGGVRHCMLEGCTGIRLGVRWPDGKMTWPCTKGLVERPDGAWQLL